MGGHEYRTEYMGGVIFSQKIFLHYNWDYRGYSDNLTLYKGGYGGGGGGYPMPKWGSGGVCG